jgi:hypothetical protein
MEGWVQIVFGISCVVSILVNLGVLITLLMIYKKLNPVLTEVQSQVKKLGEKGNEIAVTAKATVDRVHDRTEQMLGTAQNASAHVTQKVGAASAALTTVFVALRVFGFARGLMAGKSKPRREVEIKRIRA